MAGLRFLGGYTDLDVGQLAYLLLEGETRGVAICFDADVQDPSLAPHLLEGYAFGSDYNSDVPVDGSGNWCSGGFIEAVPGLMPLVTHYPNDPHPSLSNAWIWTDHAAGGSSGGDDTRSDRTSITYHALHTGYLAEYLTKPILTATPSSGHVDLAWTASVKNDSVGTSVVYDVYRGGSLIASNLSGLTLSDTGLGTSYSHTYRVRAKWFVYGAGLTRDSDTITASFAAPALGVSFDGIELG